jgi:hypothetical protein
MAAAEDVHAGVVLCSLKGLVLTVLYALFCCPGIITWLPWAADSLLTLTAGFGPPALQPGHMLLSGAMNLLVLWSLLHNMTMHVGSRLNLHPGAWLAGPQLQLLHKVLLQPTSDAKAWIRILNDVIATAITAFDLPSHPQLCKCFTGRPGDVWRGATAAGALRQVRLTPARLQRMTAHRA